MNNLYNIRDGLGKAWDNVADGWQHLYQRTKGALTHFDDKTLVPTDKENKRLNWGLLNTDLVDNDNEMLVTMELPGLDKGDIDVNIDGDVLTVSGTKRYDNERQDGNYHIMECAYGSFQRRFQLPTAGDESNVDATYEQGVLKLNIPKTTPSHKRQIKVN